MPKGKLYFKSALTSGWVDAWERYGLGLEDGALSNLIAPAPLKKPVSNSNALKHGIACLEDSIGKKDSKSVSLEIHLCAKSDSEFIDKFSLFCSEVLDQGYFMLKTCYFPDTVYHMIYQDCQPFQQWNQRMAKFTLSLIEPHPEIHTEI